MDSEQPHNTVLTGGLRRVLLGAFLFSCLLAAVQIVAVGNLQRQIGHWTWTTEINAQREQLLVKTYALLGGQNDVAVSDVLTSFEGLRRAIDAGASSGELGGVSDLVRMAGRFASLEAEARALFVRAEQKRETLEEQRQNILQNVDALQDLGGSWSVQLREEESAVLLEADAIDSRSREIESLKSTLTSVLLGAQLLQQQVIAIERLIETSPPEITRSSVLALDSSGLPAVCEPGEEEGADRICSPSVARVLSALERLRAGDDRAIPQNVNFTLLGLQAYIRAARLRYDALSSESLEVLAQMGSVRDRLSNLNTLESSMGRINRVLLNIEVVLNQQATSLASTASLDQADRQMRSSISQAQLRMSGMLTLAPRLAGTPQGIEAQTERMSRIWDEARETLSELIETLDRFDTAMEELSSAIETHTDEVRRETTIWVGLFTSSFLLLALALVAAGIGVYWYARRRFMAPLAHVTGTILGLARGNLERPVALEERAFGFDMLGTALEQLRGEMAERHRLAERTSEQQRIIEENLAELERTSEEMEWMAMHDPLTGLANRRQADLDLAKLSGSGSSAQTDFCVMQIDIDRFKAINDALGHPAGDFVLRTVSRHLTENAGPGAKCYRIGGDEFLVVFSEDLTPERASELADRIIRHVEAPIDFQGHICNVGASIGIAFGSDASFDAMQCVSHADLALYHVKKTGRGAFKFFTEDLARLARRRNVISDRLLAAIERKTLVPFYQPQFDAATRRLRGVEVLCRWYDDDLGWVSPGEFLSVADELNAVGTIDGILFEKVAEDLQELAQVGLSVPRVSFNVAADRLLKSNLAAELSERIGPYAGVAVELLESMSLDNPTESVSWALDEFREHGIEIEIDDFGSDRASLAGVMAINPHAMKIDRSLVMPIVQSPRHKDIVRKIIDIGTALNIEVVAEGVETEDHAEQLLALGCDVLQGFGLARPMPFADLVPFCRDHMGREDDPSTIVA